MDFWSDYGKANAEEILFWVPSWRKLWHFSCWMTFLFVKTDIIDYLLVLPINLNSINYWKGKNGREWDRRLFKIESTCFHICIKLQVEISQATKHMQYERDSSKRAIWATTLRHWQAIKMNDRTWISLKVYNLGAGVFFHHIFLDFLKTTSRNCTRMEQRTRSLSHQYARSNHG